MNIDYYTLEEVFKNNNIYPFTAANIQTVWESKNAIQDLKQLIIKHINGMNDYFLSQGYPSLTNYDEYQSYYEDPELSWMADFCINNLIFCKTQLQGLNDSALADTMNAFWHLLGFHHRYQDQDEFAFLRCNQTIQIALGVLFQNKVLTKVQVKKVLDYCKQTFFRHFHLYQYCMRTRQLQKEKNVTIYTPQPLFTHGNLSSQEAREIVDEKHEDQASQMKHQAEQDGGLESQREVEQEDEIDPDEPLYGLDQRLRNLNLDDESRRIIKDKLEEANNKIKMALEDRQKNLDSKLGGGPPKKK